MTRLAQRAWLLAAANLIPLLGVLFFQWELAAVMAAFWVENIVLGLMAAIRMAVINPRMAVYMVPFFLAHFGGFTAIHGIFIWGLFVVGPGGTPASKAGGIEGLVVPILVAGAALLVRHGIETWHDLRRGLDAARDGGILSQMMRPYGPLALLHVSVIVGAFVVMATGAGVLALAFLVLAKAGVDLGILSFKYRGGPKRLGRRYEAA